jgi:UDP-N-acetylmuramate dehydrogenase
MNGLALVEPNLLEVDAGTLMTSAGDMAAQESLSGFEELSTIPGSVGGAVYMNAGCYGKQIGTIVERVEVFNRARLQFDVLRSSMICWKYRWSSLQDRNLVVTRVWVRLERGIPELIRERTEQTWSRRQERFPLDEPSAGSVFKRPQSGPPAGQLIEELGLKGYSIGGARVSTKHAGWIVNAGNATSADIQALIYFVQAAVKTHHGIQLDIEQCII